LSALLFVGVLALVALSFSLRTYLRCRKLLASARLTTEAQDDELERRLLARERALELALAGRSVQVLGRSSLFGGTGAAVWELSGGSSHYLGASVAFGLGLVGWTGCGELGRRIGSLAGSLPRTKQRRAMG
jgi:hypothetical protein